VRDRLAEFLAQDPAAARILVPVRPAQIEEHHIRIDADTELDNADAALIDEGPQGGNVFGADLLLQHVDLP
jgi:hypothetical protein